MILPCLFPCFSVNFSVLDKTVFSGFAKVSFFRRPHGYAYPKMTVLSINLHKKHRKHLLAETPLFKREIKHGKTRKTPLFDAFRGHEKHEKHHFFIKFRGPNSRTLRKLTKPVNSVFISVFITGFSTKIRVYYRVFD